MSLFLYTAARVVSISSHPAPLPSCDPSDYGTVFILANATTRDISASTNPCSKHRGVPPSSHRLGRVVPEVLQPAKRCGLCVVRPPWPYAREAEQIVAHGDETTGSTGGEGYTHDIIQRISRGTRPGGRDLPVH